MQVAEKTYSKEDLDSLFDHTFVLTDAVSYEQLLKFYDLTYVSQSSESELLDKLFGILENDEETYNAVEYIKNLRKKASYNENGQLKTIGELKEEFNE